MSSSNCYEVTAWPVGDPIEDIGEVIISIIADIRGLQTVADDHGRASQAR